uniref:Uncharacterized protein n=1 Tax=Candidatus Methanophagaceae archaeon ANME-1 ERB6 TaxID=2759912 RepID=A0A7G9YY40_9EURY|nr:hypothetical protein PANBHIFL_00039 [Methanosarcinales archaeon ANME-1 ERB6]
MYPFSPILADVEESDLFTMPSNVFSDKQRTKLLQVEDYQWNQWKDVWTEESSANFFRCFPSCCAVTAVL